VHTELGPTGHHLFPQEGCSKHFQPQECLCIMWGLTGHLRPTGPFRPSGKNWQRWQKVQRGTWLRPGYSDLKYSLFWVGHGGEKFIIWLLFF
jgi:hypothetical protein